MDLESHLELLRFLNLLNPNRSRELSDLGRLDSAIVALLN